MLSNEEMKISQEKSMEVCRQSYIMYENSLKDAEIMAKKTDGTRKQSILDNMELIRTAQQDIVTRYVQLGGKEEDLKNLKTSTKKGINRQLLQKIIKENTAREEMTKYLENLKKTQDNTVNTQEEQTTPEIVTDRSVNVEPEIGYYDTSYGTKPVEEKVSVPEVNTPVNTQQAQSQNELLNNSKMYDVVTLPSKGECYRNKKKTVKVGYLTAYDENMILSPNLYKDGKFVNYLLKAKIIDGDFNVDDLTRGDRDAIVMWLRATGYGNEYPIIVTDDETGKEFETKVDLTKLKYRKFTLKGDENGYFDFTLPSRGDIIKFKFLTIRDLDMLDKLKDAENREMKLWKIRNTCDELLDVTKDPDIVSLNTQQKLKTVVNTLQSELENSTEGKKSLEFSHELTDRLLMQTVSVNGITDRKYIENYIYTMNVKDATAYRKYIIENEPGVDFNIEVERPVSLGGGSIKSFLQFDQFIFINV